MPFAVIFFLGIMVVAVPFLSIYNLKMIAAIREMMMPDKKKMYLQSAMNQIFLTAVALWAAEASVIELEYRGMFSNLVFTAAGAFLIIAFLTGYLTNKNKDLANENPGLDLLKPETSSEKITWIFVNLIAATCEEVIFRGVLFQIFLRTTDNLPMAAVMSALCFGFSHSVQGIMGILITTVFGLGLQYLVYLNNGLLIAMLVHFIYNMGTTFLVLNNKKQENKAE
jgi:membrane protease YdiL (CAAX protease family)